MSYQNYGYNQNGYGQPGYGQAEPTANNNGTALGWDDEVEEKSFILLPEGEYPFRVEGFDREQHNGTEKMPPCNVANLHIVINVDKWTAVCVLPLDRFTGITGWTHQDGLVKGEWCHRPTADQPS